MTAVVDAPVSVERGTDMPDESQFKALLSEKLTEADGRNIFTGTQVKDMLLDLWNALNIDVGFVHQNPDDRPVPDAPATDAAGDIFAGVTS